MKHLGFYIFNGLALSPQADMKLWSKTNPLNGNDFGNQYFLSNI